MKVIIEQFMNKTRRLKIKYDWIVVFFSPRDSSNKSQLSIRIRVKSRCLASPSKQQFGQPATSERDAASATTSGRAGGTGTGCTGGPGRPGFSTTASNNISSTPRSSTQLPHKSLYGASTYIVVC